MNGSTCMIACIPSFVFSAGAALARPAVTMTKKMVLMK